MSRSGSARTTVDAALATELLHRQFPQLAGSEPRAVPTSGTDNALFRLEPDLVLRFPRVDWAAAQPEREHAWLPHLAPQLPLPVPEPIGLGVPDAGYPWHWSVHRWIPGVDAHAAPPEDLEDAARGLGRFVRALCAIDAEDGPRAGRANVGRGLPLATRDDALRGALERMGELDPDEAILDRAAVLDVWLDALAAPEWNAPPVWVHGDLHGGNLLVADGRIAAVIDWGLLGVGDPAVDLLGGWYLFEGEARRIFRDAVDLDDDAWARGRGWALSMAVIGVPYYLDRDPAFVAQALRVVDRILREGDAS